MNASCQFGDQTQEAAPRPGGRSPTAWRADQLCPSRVLEQGGGADPDPRTPPEQEERLVDRVEHHRGAVHRPRGRRVGDRDQLSVVRFRVHVSFQITVAPPPLIEAAGSQPPSRTATLSAGSSANAADSRAGGAAARVALRQVSFAKLKIHVWLSTVCVAGLSSPPNRMAYRPSPVTAREAFVRGEGDVGVWTTDHTPVDSFTRTVRLVRPAFDRPPKRRTVPYGSLVAMEAPCPAMAPSGKVGGTMNGWGSQSYSVVTRGWGSREGGAARGAPMSGASGATWAPAEAGRPYTPANRATAIAAARGTARDRYGDAPRPRTVPGDRSPRLTLPGRHIPAPRESEPLRTGTTPRPNRRPEAPAAGVRRRPGGGHERNRTVFLRWQDRQTVWRLR